MFRNQYFSTVTPLTAAFIYGELCKSFKSSVFPVTTTP
ncbi:hypothetical protein bpmyx0001_40770 [Bacillus pseudomycoides DSM 12442]|nr:hypothetical protein bpmyx0001_40770 [Bacillus pseudomycoides DSM 12442]